ncbi:hypothetical protein [Aliivibrio logei]|uniref:Uncharacterized protein n=1 Tax=Aliivibrio logei TaxID=688 RepID=A0A1B9NUP1_ALILO|nr:hypothetical protein [Aliivibrio logei]OCH17762.1 hypothetical protein A6E04_18040 [Aliivibrio logei]
MDKGLEIKFILYFLNSLKIRATYKAVGDLVGLAPVGVSNYLGKKRPFASWIVSSDSKKSFMPTGYNENEIHPDLKKSKVLMTVEELTKEIDKHN